MNRDSEKNGRDASAIHASAVGDRVTLADIGFTAEIIQPSQTRRGELGVVVGESADQ
jgi:hypothetical protein